MRLHQPIRARIATIAAALAMTSVSAFGQAVPASGQSGQSILNQAVKAAADSLTPEPGEVVRRISIDEAVKLAFRPRYPGHRRLSRPIGLGADVQFDAVAIGVLIAPSLSNKLHDLATLLEERCRTRGGAQERDDNHSICSRELMDRTAGTV